jgi:two-component system response regulator NreC
VRTKVLIVDDHHLMIEGYKSILSTIGYDIEIVSATTSESAYNIITKSESDSFDLVYLDRSLPPYIEGGINNGEGLAVLIARLFPDWKVIFLTSHCESFILYDLVKKVNPDGVLVKSDFNSEEFLIAFNEVLSGRNYYSHTVRKSMEKMTSRRMYLDNYNRQIIVLLARGIKTKNLPNYLPLSISAIDKRKVQIKDFFEIEKGNDEDILSAAKKQGYI